MAAPGDPDITPDNGGAIVIELLLRPQSLASNGPLRAPIHRPRQRRQREGHAQKKKLRGQRTL
eukprot:9088221-Pyramimonas_sp.AAC.1